MFINVDLATSHFYWSRQVVFCQTKTFFIMNLFFCNTDITFANIAIMIHLHNILYYPSQGVFSSLEQIDIFPPHIIDFLCVMLDSYTVLFVVFWKTPTVLVTQLHGQHTEEVTVNIPPESHSKNMFPVSNKIYLWKPGDSVGRNRWNMSKTTTILQITPHSPPVQTLFLWLM